MEAISLGVEGLIRGSYRLLLGFLHDSSEEKGSQGNRSVSYKGPESKYFWPVGDLISVATTLLRQGSMKAAMVKEYM